MSTTTSTPVIRTPIEYGLDVVRATHTIHNGTTALSLSAAAVVPTGRPVTARLFHADSYAEPYVQVSLVDDKDRELARARAYVGSHEAQTVKEAAIESAAKALVVLLDGAGSVRVSVAGKAYDVIRALREAGEN